MATQEQKEIYQAQLEKCVRFFNEVAELLKDTVWEREETRREKMVVIRQIEADEQLTAERKQMLKEAMAQALKG